MPSFSLRLRLVVLALAALLALPSLALASGMLIDPNGRTVTVSQASGDAGMLIDPDGGR